MSSEQQYANTNSRSLLVAVLAVLALLLLTVVAVPALAEWNAFVERALSGGVV